MMSTSRTIKSPSSLGSCQKVSQMLSLFSYKYRAFVLRLSVPAFAKSHSSVPRGIISGYILMAKIFFRRAFTDVYPSVIQPIVVPVMYICALGSIENFPVHENVVSRNCVKKIEFAVLSSTPFPPYQLRVVAHVYQCISALSEIYFSIRKSVQKMCILINYSWNSKIWNSTFLATNRSGVPLASTTVGTVETFIGSIFIDARMIGGGRLGSRCISVH
jgi:hypothetical protein